MNHTAQVVPYDASKHISSGTLVLGGIPAAVIDPLSGLTAMGISSSCFAVAFALEAKEAKEVIRTHLLLS